MLRFGLDLSEKQVAEAMRCAPGTVKSTVSRALTNLREQMAAEDVGAAREGNDDDDDE